MKKLCTYNFSLLKYKTSTKLKENLAAARATEVHSLLTQHEKQLKKISFRHRVLQVKLTIVQGEYLKHLIWMIEK